MSPLILFATLPAQADTPVWESLMVILDKSCSMAFSTQVQADAVPTCGVPTETQVHAVRLGLVDDALEGVIVEHVELDVSAPVGVVPQHLQIGVTQEGTRWEGTAIRSSEPLDVAAPHEVIALDLFVADAPEGPRLECVSVEVAPTSP